MPRLHRLGLVALLGLIATACSTGPTPLSDDSPPHAVEQAKKAQDATDAADPDRTIYASSRPDPVDDAPEIEGTQNGDDGDDDDREDTDDDHSDSDD